MSHFSTRSLLPALAAAVAFFLWTASPAPAVIIFGDGDPDQDVTGLNTTAPTGELAGSGWQYEGEVGPFLGTPIGPRHFITAAHFGPAGEITFQGVTYDVARHPVTNDLLAYRDPGTDLIIYQITGTFPTYAPLWNRPGAEPGQALVVIGRGTQRGSPIQTGADNHLDGWAWGPGDAVRRWGQNEVADIVDGGPGLGKLIRATFDAGGGFNEAALSAGDSGGAVFIQDPADHVWKLAGINYGVDGPYYRANTPTPPTPEANPGFLAALFDGLGLYEYDSGQSIYVNAMAPNGFYATQIADRLPFINVVLGNSPLAKVGSDVLFGFASESGKRYRVERCDDLAVGPWTPVADNLDGNGGTLLVTDAGAASAVRRFYRVVTLSPP